MILDSEESESLKTAHDIFQFNQNNRSSDFLDNCYHLEIINMKLKTVGDFF